MKKHFHIKQHKIPLYGGLLITLLSNDNGRVDKQIPFRDNPVLYAHSYLDKYKNTQGYYLVLNFNSGHGKMTHGTIAHEAIHIADFLLYDRGVVADFMNDEPVAYLVDWIVTQTYKFIKKHNFKVEI